MRNSISTNIREELARSVIAVPPLCRNQLGNVDIDENRRLVQHIEAGGVTTLLYGGNANFYHLALSEYRDVLGMLTDISASQTWVIPSAGPAFGTAMDQARVLREFDFPTVMLLPQKEIATSDGIAEGVRRFVREFGKPIVLYLKHNRIIEPDAVKLLVDEGLVSFIKYAVVLENPSHDSYLTELTDVVDVDRIVSGIGEQPAITHLRDFGVASFTSGCVCVAPALSMTMLDAIQSSDWETAESIRRTFSPLEDLRNNINPIRVLHRAVELAAIANTGPLQPLLGNVPDDAANEIRIAAEQLLAANGVRA